MPLRLELVQARSYRGDSPRPGPLVLNLDLLSSDVRGRDVLLVDARLAVYCADPSDNARTGCISIVQVPGCQRAELQKW